MAEVNNYKKLVLLRRLKTAIRWPVGCGLIVALWLKKILFHRNHECIVIACMPKSASTFLSNSLSLLTGYQLEWPNSGGGRHEQNLDFPKLIDLYGRKGICQMHLKATEQNLFLIERFSIKPIVLVRNIFDVVISCRDHMHSEDTNGPMVWANEEFFNLDESAQLDFIIELSIPWFISFYVSWFSASQDGLVNPIWLSYEEITANPHLALRSIVDAYNIDKSGMEIENSLKQIKQHNTRFNKGISGRGQQELTEEQIQKIVAFTRFYPWVDFSKIGIT